MSSNDIDVRGSRCRVNVPVHMQNEVALSAPEEDDEHAEYV